MGAGFSRPHSPAAVFGPAEAGPTHEILVMHAIRTEAHKNYTVGFWRPRPYRALHALTLEVGQGEVFGFLGPNGAGKTTTLKLLIS